MRDCCETATDQIVLTDDPIIALAGNPNSGKSTLFNLLTGSRQRVINAPRTTVELAMGRWQGAGLPGGGSRLVDLPGAYDIVHGSPDETLTADVFADAGSTASQLEGQTPALAIVTIDASAPARSLYLLAQLAQRRVPAVLAVTMGDVARDRGSIVTADAVATVTGLPAVSLDPRAGKGVEELEAAVAHALRHPRIIAIDEGEGAALDWAHQATLTLVPLDTTKAKAPLSDRIDRALLHPVVGVPVFLAVLWACFELITVVAAPAIDAVDRFWSGPVLDGARSLIPGDGWWEGAIVDGVLAGVGAVLSFVPLMILAFLAFAFLEDSGYLARASFVADRALRLIGLDGRAVLPLILGYGCNLPALAGLKVLPDARQRLATALLIPFTSCTARLPVYLLLAATFFPQNAGTAVFLLYVLSGVMVITAGLVAKSTILRKARPAMTLTVLPAFQRPRARALTASALARVKSFVIQAGTVIVVALAGMWLIAAIPTQGGHSFGSVPAEDSAYAAGARAVAPVLAPMGADDWHAASALATGLVAKELVVAAFAQSYALEEGATDDLKTQLRSSFDESSGGQRSAAAAAFLVFVALYTPCFATLGELRRQFGFRWAGASMGLGLVVAYLAATTTFQLARLL